MTTNIMSLTARAEYERELDQALVGSFPASDPLPWTLGVAVEPAMVHTARLPRPRAAASDVIVGSERSTHRARAIAELVGLTMLVPLGVLVTGLPVAAAVGALLSIVFP